MMTDTALCLMDSAAVEGTSPERRELTEIEINRDLPLPQRIRQFIDDVGDPYHFTVKGTNVTVSFTGKNSINVQLARALNAVVDAA